MQVLAFLVLPLASVAAWLLIAGSWDPWANHLWATWAAHVVVPAVVSYLVARRHPTVERALPALIGLGSAVAVLVLSFLVVLVYINALESLN